MMSLFSSFDPNVYGMPLNWGSVVFSLVLIPSSFWVLGNQINKSCNNLLTYVKGEFMAIFGSLVAPGVLWVPLSLFLFIVFMNFNGLLPYVFPATSHLTMSISLALPLWVGHMSMSWMVQPKGMFAHLVPLGTPAVLIPFMVVIEMVSSLIRPLTLSVRLAANIIAGHLLLTLMGGLGEHLMFWGVGGLLIGLVALSILETAVGFIQAYVFSVLSVLYLGEVNSKEIN